MRSFLCSLLFVIACGGTDDDNVDKPSLEGPYDCGPHTCTTGQICITVESGSQCGVSEENGIGQYQVYQWSCADLPAECNGLPSCDCVSGGGICFGPNGREVSFGCI